MSTKSVIIKQSIKYFFIIVVFLFSISIIRLLFSVEPIVFWWIIGTTGLIIVIGMVFDILSAKDILPFFQK